MEEKYLFSMENDKTQFIDDKVEYKKDKNYKYKLQYLKIKNRCYLSLILLIILNIFFISFSTNPNKQQYPGRLQSLKKLKKYIKSCFQGLYLNDNAILNYNSSNPKISVVIPVYNCNKTIKAAVRSIQNQNMGDIEIILVNDLSKDNTSKIIQELSEEDPRIKIINNKKNSGTLYSRNIGILNSKGKYVMNLDNDDLFLDNEVFDDIYKEMNNTNFDIIGFNELEAHNYDPLGSQLDTGFFYKPNNYIVYQPELRYYPYTKDDKFYPNDYLVWGRLVKSDLYKKAINNLGKDIFGEERGKKFLCYNEDTTMTIALFTYAQSFKFVARFGIFHYLGITTASNTRPSEENTNSHIFILDMLFDFTENDISHKKYVAEFALDLNEKNIDTEKNINYVKILLQRIYDCKYISEVYKDKLKQKFSYIYN